VGPLGGVVTASERHPAVAYLVDYHRRDDGQKVENVEAAYVDPVLAIEDDHDDHP